MPLGDLLRLVSGDPEYLPRGLPGGEDWLATYKSFWRERIEDSLEEWRSDHRAKELVAEIVRMLGGGRDDEAASRHARELLAA